MCTMHKSKKISMGDVNPHLLCVLCGGYFIDATTIIECLHSFCRTCLVRYLETNKTCPICEVLIHKTRPHQNIRSDKTLQDIVYKLVPGLYKDEMKRRREFYDQYPIKDGCKTPSEERGDEMAERFIFTENEKISLALEYWIDGIKENLESDKKPEKRELTDETKIQKRDVRYLQCPGALTVAHLKKFIRLKFELPHRCRIDIYHQKEILSDYYTLLDIACIFSWKRMEPLRLYYTIYENIIRKRKAEEIENKVVTSEETDTKTSTTEKSRSAPEDEAADKSTTAVAPKDQHKFLAPTATKACSSLPVKHSIPQQVPILPKPPQSNAKATAKSVVGPPLQKPPVPEPQKSLVSNKILASNTKTTTQQTSKPGPSKPTTNQPTRIAPKLPTNLQPIKTVKQQIENYKQANQQAPATVLLTDKPQNGLLVSRSPVMVKASAVGGTQSNKQTPAATAPCAPPLTVNTLTAQHKMPGQVPLAASTQQQISKKMAERNHSIAQSAAQNSKIINQLPTKSTDTTAKVSATSPAPNISKEPVPKLNGNDVKSPTQVTSAAKDVNGGRKSTNIDLTSLPEGAVIRSVKSPFTGAQKQKNDVIPPKPTSLDVNNKKSASEKKVEGNLTDDAKNSLKKSTGGENPAKNNKVGENQPNTKLNGCARPCTPKPTNGSRPSTPKVNSGSRPSTPKTNGTSRPSTPKTNGNSRPATPKTNGTSRPATPKTHESCRPTTAKVNGDIRSFKPIAPKLPAPRNDGVSDGGKHVKAVELQIPMNYSKGHAEKRAIPMMDSSSSDICEEIRQRKLARMDEPLNLVKRDQDKSKPVSPINGNVSPRNNLQMIVGSAGI